MIYFRCEVSDITGWGHFKRCLVLAEAMNNTVPTCLIIQSPTVMMKNLIANAGAQLFEIPADLTYVEEIKHYPADCKNIIIDLCHRQNLENPEGLLAYLNCLSTKGIQIAFIDGLDDDSLRDERAPQVTAYVQPYFGVQEDCPPNAKHWFYGPKYTLLDNIYASAYRKREISRIKNILITFGGADPQGNTIKALQGIAKDRNVNIRVIIGPSFAKHHIKKIKEFCADQPYEIIEAPENLFTHYDWADLGICGSSTSRYEALACGLPVIFTAIYPQHHHLSETYAALGASQYVGLDEDTSSDDWNHALSILQDTPKIYKNMLICIAKMQYTAHGAESLSNALLEVFHS